MRKKLFALLMTLTLIITMIPTAAFGATTQSYELGLVGYSNSRTKIGGKYFFVNDSTTSVPNKLYVSSTSKGKRTLIHTQGKGQGWASVLSDGKKVFYQHVDSNGVPTIYATTISGKTTTKYTATKGKARDHMELIGIYNNKLYYGYSSYKGGTYSLKSLNLKTKKVTKHRSEFYPYTSLDNRKKTGDKANNRYIYGYFEDYRDKTMVYDCKLNKCKTYDWYLERVVGSKIYYRDTTAQGAQSTLYRCGLSGSSTEPEKMLTAQMDYVEKITSKYIKYSSKKPGTDYDYNYYKYNFETGVTEELTIDEYYKY